MKLFRIETCVPLGLTSRGRCCGTGMITTKIMESALIQMSLPPTAMLIRSRPFPLGMGVCWPWAPKKVQWQGCCSKKAVTLWWWQETSKQSFAMVCRRAPLGKIWSCFLCSLQCKSWILLPGCPCTFKMHGKCKLGPCFTFVVHPVGNTIRQVPEFADIIVTTSQCSSQMKLLLFQQTSQ